MYMLQKDALHKTIRSEIGTQKWEKENFFILHYPFYGHLIKR